MINLKRKNLSSSVPVEPRPRAPQAETTKTHDRKIKVQVKRKMNKHAEKTKVRKVGEPKG